MTPAEIWHIEVGTRAALHTRTTPGDMRWWLGLWGRR